MLDISTVILPSKSPSLASIFNCSSGLMLGRQPGQVSLSYAYRRDKLSWLHPIN